jgi:hypothetical protein
MDTEHCQRALCLASALLAMSMSEMPKEDAAPIAHALTLIDAAIDGMAGVGFSSEAMELIAMAQAEFAIAQARGLLPRH